MSIESWTIIGISCQILATAILIFLLILNYKYFKQMEKQLHLQTEQIHLQTDQIKQTFYMEYTKRFQEIILHLPTKIHDDQFSINELKDEEHEETMRYMRVYFDLCYEESFLKQQGHIDQNVWDDWKQGMKSMFKKQAFKDAWEIITEKSGIYEEKFKDFVVSKMSK